MFLKSLTMRGFKSFADRTVFEFEPGITVLVGPNGSGKSNVVDAIAWVLGTRSAKLLRGGELADVIFAGSPSRPPAGNALVEIVIDNSEGQLGSGALGAGGSAQGFSEVRISREIDPSGTSTYRINGQECRLLDIQELLSDTGMGRELHTVVGQGQLDTILHAKAEDRRAFIEEAAGILKHRHRRERAERKLEQVEGHLDKLRSILRELRRQLKPLERQAEQANRHEQLQAELRDVRIRLAVHELSRLRADAAQVAAGDEDVRARHEQLQEEAERLQVRVESLEGELAELTPSVDAARDSVEHLARLRERLHGTAELVEARRRHLLDYVEEPLAGRPPDELRAQAARLDEEREARERELAAARETLEETAAASRDAQAARREHERRLATAERERAAAREEHVRWQSDVRARRDALEAAEAETLRLSRQLDDLEQRRAQLENDIETVQEHIRRLDAEEWRLTEALESAESAVNRAEADLEAAVHHERELERERASHAARAEALRAASKDAGDGAAALMAGNVAGVEGLLADQVRIESGAEAAVAAALGPLGEAVVVASVDHARQAITHLRDGGHGRARLIPLRPATADARDVDEDEDELDGARHIASFLRARTHAGTQLVDSLRHGLARTYVVASWDRAVVLQRRYPRCTFVTRRGDVAGPWGFAGGSAPEPSVVVNATAAETAERHVTNLERRLSATRERVGSCQRALAARRAELEVATREINESDARITGAAEQLAQLHRERDGLERQRTLVAEQRQDLLDAAERHREALLRLNDTPRPSPDPEPEIEIEEAAAEYDAAVESARQAEIDARSRVERLDEQVRHLERAADELRSEADEVEATLADAARRRELRRHHVRRCGALAAVCADAQEALAASLRDAREKRDRLTARRAERESALGTARSRQRELGGELDAARERRHEADLRRSELEHRMEQVVERLRDEFGLTEEDAQREYHTGVDADREELAQREDTLVRKLGMLGRINPLALEEFHALEERHGFLSRQLEDLRSSKRDLQRVIVAVDDKIRDVFAAAFEDVAHEFQQVFATVFPGGEGRLVLTDPEDMLTTGVEIEARPPGKRIRRLSLLSGGERSLTALAVLFAIFRARPSPFYVLDEVEAALDDVNLQRLLGVLESFKEHSQLLVVTHQQRTMGVADLLYGVTMGSDAVSKVVAERMHDGDPVAV